MTEESESKMREEYLEHLLEGEMTTNPDSGFTTMSTMMKTISSDDFQKSSNKYNDSKTIDSKPNVYTYKS